MSNADGFIRRRALHLSSHPPNDWCHLCGQREPELPLADCWYPDPSHGGGAEHKPDGPRDEYVRICAECGSLISSVATGGEATPNSERRRHEYRYRTGVHQAFAILRRWLTEHPDADVLEVLEILRILARQERSRVPLEGRQIGDFLIDRLLTTLDAELEVRKSLPPRQ